MKETGEHIHFSMKQNQSAWQIARMSECVLLNIFLLIKYMGPCKAHTHILNFSHAYCSITMKNRLSLFFYYIYIHYYHHSWCIIITIILIISSLIEYENGTQTRAIYAENTCGYRHISHEGREIQCRIAEIYSHMADLVFRLTRRWRYTIHTPSIIIMVRSDGRKGWCAWKRAIYDRNMMYVTI